MWSEIKGQLVSADVASQHWRLICDCMDWHVKQQGIEQNWSLQWSHHWEQYTKLRFLYSLSATYADFSNQVCKYALDLSIDTIYAYDLRSSREKEKKKSWQAYTYSHHCWEHYTWHSLASVMARDPDNAGLLNSDRTMTWCKTSQSDRTSTCRIEPINAIHARKHIVSCLVCWTIRANCLLWRLFVLFWW